MHYLPLPRRRYRALFFPPGLLALAGLLWLGCVAVPKSKLTNTKQVVLEIMVPPLHPPKDVQQMWYPVYASQREIELFRPWHTYTLNGNFWADYHTLQLIKNDSEQLANLDTQPRGVRIYMTGNTSYSSFIFLESTLQELAIRKYWLDFRHNNSTLYVLGNQPPTYPSFVCGLGYYTPTISENIARWFANRRADLLSLDWRNTWLLLLLLTTLSAWKLRRQWRTAS